MFPSLRRWRVVLASLVVPFASLNAAGLYDDAKASPPASIVAAEEADKHLGELTRNNPRNAEARLARGLNYLQWTGLAQKQESDLPLSRRLIDSAVAEFTKALELSPGDLRAHAERGDARMFKSVLLGQSHAALKAAREAVADFEAVLKQDPKYPKAVPQRMVAKKRVHELEDALE